ncbi:translation initiation factor 2 [Paenibacillus sp. HB172176]|uniref:translation initiation factor 2 n=1 Tax=Paenibacillus sp. HB172176 TaxID=2493690 RepID=UPI001F0CDF4D|nr:translation initiation factor 2 [Paenibacillus sp. HB172176]
MGMSDSGNDDELDQLSAYSEIQIARLAFIGATIATIGDGLAALAAGLALEDLENPINQRSQHTHHHQLLTAQRNLDYYIGELIKARKHIR